MCCGEQVQPPTQRAANFVIILKILFVLQFIISISNLATVIFIREGVLGLIFLTILLYIAFYKLSYQSIVVTTFLAMFFFITFLVFVMTMYIFYNSAFKGKQKFKL